jgi:hypothetical protein
MRAECQFAKAGQGLFYNGILVDKKGHTFSFVYDCGTFGASQVLSNSVSEYKSFIKKRLDILFISHFHRDHISHIPKLIENLELNHVIFPNVLPEVRLLLATRIEGIERNSELISLYSDPSKYFAERGAKRVISLSFDNENGEPLFPIEDDANYRSDYVEDKEHENEDIEERNRIIMHSQSGTLDAKSFIKECNGVAYFYLPHYAWEFRANNIYYERYDSSFLVEVRELISNNDKDLNKLLRNPEQVKRLRKIYDDHFDGKLNDTSVVVRSRPVRRGFVVGSNSNITPHFHVNSERDKFRDYYYENGHAETLLLGDITMDFKVFDHLLYRHPKGIEYLPRVIQLPHHGARMRCHPMCCDMYHHIGRNGLCSEFVASYGLTNSYGHPDFHWQRKCRDICFDYNRYPTVRLVNERSDFTYTILYE